MHLRDDRRIHGRGRRIVQVVAGRAVHGSALVPCADPATRRRFCIRGKNAAQYVHFIQIQLRALQKAADTAHEMGAGLGPVLEVDLLQHLLEVHVQLLHLRRARQRRICNLSHRSGAAVVGTGAEDLVAHQLYRHSEIQRGVLAAGRNPQQHMTCFQMLVHQTRTLGSEQQRHRGAPCLRNRALGRLAHVQYAKILITVPRGGGGDKTTIGNRRLEGGNDPGTRQHRFARALASGCGNSRGRTRTSCVRSIFIMARATAPMLPGWDGSTSTIRMSGVESFGIGSNR